MAIETRAFQFLRSSTEGEVDPQTIFVPTDRVYHRVITGPIGPIVLVRGEWNATESVDITFVPIAGLPTTSNVIGAWSDDNGNGFVGVAIES